MKKQLILIYGFMATSIITFYVATAVGAQPNTVYLATEIHLFVAYLAATILIFRDAQAKKREFVAKCDAIIRDIDKISSKEDLYRILVRVQELRSGTK